MRAQEISLFADYFQFYIQDEAATGDLSDSWNEATTDRMLAVAPGTVGVGTVRNMSVPVALEIHEQEPADDVSEWDHAVEASLDVASGRFFIAGCTDYVPDALHVEVPAGTYRVRVSYGSLNSLSEDELSGDDHYRVQVWPGPLTDVRVLKQRVP